MARLFAAGLLLCLSIGHALAGSDDIPRALQTIRPGAQWTITGTDCSALVWMDQAQAKPTCAEISAAVTTLPAKDPVMDNFDGLTLRVLFNHENRIRALEGKAAITVVQFKAALKGLP